jgi:predicted transcriptional regulator
MDNEPYNDVIKSVAKSLLLNPQRMIREDDLKFVVKGFQFERVMVDVYENLKNVGFELIKTKFDERTYYVLTSEGKDDNLSPTQYGILAMIIAISKEMEENIALTDLKEIFFEVWDTDISYLIAEDYLREDKEIGIIKITPLGKALVKDIINDLNLNNLLKSFDHE